MAKTSWQIHVPLEAFEKAGDPNPMRIGGMASTDGMDQQDERVLAEGLDFRPFLEKGWFNDNHGQRTADVLGYPTAARTVRKGERLPTGTDAASNGLWVEGYLLPTDEGKRVFDLAQALQKAGGPRRLGYSVEGKVVQRDASNPGVIRRAVVRNVAITHCPVNTETELLTLAKSLSAGDGPATGASEPGDGSPLRQQDLSGVDTDGKRRKKKPDDDDLAISKAAARALVRAQFPHITPEQVDRIVAQAAGRSAA